jgi:predicted nucleic acid-binding protein
LVTYFFDTSALVKLYIREVGSTEVIALTSNLGNDQLVVLDLARVEARSAVRKRSRIGDLSAEVANNVIARLEEDLLQWFLTQPSNSSVIEKALRVIDLYHLKAYDAMQLAACITFAPETPGPITLVTSDRQMFSAARTEGLAVIDPETAT